MGLGDNGDVIWLVAGCHQQMCEVTALTQPMDDLREHRSPTDPSQNFARQSL